MISTGSPVLLQCWQKKSLHFFGKRNLYVKNKHAYLTYYFRQKHCITITLMLMSKATIWVCFTAYSLFCGLCIVLQVGELGQNFLFFEISRSGKIYLRYENRSKENENGRKISCFNIVTEGRFCDCCSQRYWGLKKGIFSIIKIRCVVTTRDDTKEEVVLWQT